MNIMAKINIQNETAYLICGLILALAFSPVLGINFYSWGMVGAVAVFYVIVRLLMTISTEFVRGGSSRSSGSDHFDSSDSGGCDGD